MLRGGSPRHATVWMETAGPGRVDVLGRETRTFCVEGHHFALVEVRDLAHGVHQRYDVKLDGEQVWPPPDDELPAPAIRTWEPGTPFRLVLGSCRQAAPHGAGGHRPPRADADGLGADALQALARELLRGDRPWPHALLLAGDQVYADEPDPATIEALEQRRGGPPRPGWPQIASFEEYTWLYQEAWSDPLVRWLMSCVPTSMVFDDHDVIDDWNISERWRRRIEHEPWWPGRIHGGLMSYWLYQHLGNAAWHEREDDRLLAAVRAAGDGGPLLRDFARRADAGTPGGVGHRWSYRTDLGPVRLLVVDSRNGRVLEEGRRSMLDEAEWSWLEANVGGDVDHLLVATSVPWLLPRPIHDLEAWNEQVAGGAWGRRAARAGERWRQRIDLEHWAAFGRSFHALADLLARTAAGERGRPPATALVLSGDVHFGYVAEPRIPGETRIRQVVSSPMRQAVESAERRAQRLAMTAPLALLARLLTATTPRARTDLRWSVTDGPWFDNHLFELTFDGRDVRLDVERAEIGPAGRARLVPVATRPL